MNPRSHDTNPPQFPTDMTVTFIVSLLAPFFNEIGFSDIGAASLTAREMLGAFRIRHAGDLLLAAKIIAFSVATLKVLALSLKIDLPPETLLRLHRTANALTRSAERNQALLEKSMASTTSRPVSAPMPEDLAQQEEDLRAALETSRHMVEKARRHMADAAREARGASAQTSPPESVQPSAEPEAGEETIGGTAQAAIGQRSTTPCAIIAGDQDAARQANTSNEGSGTRPGQPTIATGSPTTEPATARRTATMPARSALTLPAMAPAFDAGMAGLDLRGGISPLGLFADSAMPPHIPPNLGLAVRPGAPEPTTDHWTQAYIDAFAGIAEECAELNPGMTESERTEAVTKARALSEGVSALTARLTGPANRAKT